jgi:hypothetical protein
MTASPPQSIPVELAEDYAVYGIDRVAVQDVSEHRWYVKQLVVFELEGVLMGLHYLKPKSELQEGQDTFEATPVPVFPVAGREVKTTVYEVMT